MNNARLVDLSDYKTMYNEAPIACFTMNEAGFIVGSNQTFLDYLGIAKSDGNEILRFQDHLTVGGKIYYETHLFPLLKMQGSIREINLELLNNQQQRIPVLINSEKILSKEDQMIYYHSFLILIEQRSSFEKELIYVKKQAEELNLQLEKKNHIIEEQNKTLKKLNQTKDKFFGIIAHDLRSPLNELNSFTQMLINHIDVLSKVEIIEMSRQVETSIDNTLKLADNLIMWAQSQIEDFQARPTEFDLEEVISKAISDNTIYAQKKDIDLDYELTKGIKVVADKDQISFIIRNIILNGLKFTNQNGFVKVNAAVVNNHVEISIIDSGVGMTVETVERIFSAEKKFSSRGTAGEKGSGLGLLLSHEFVKMNNGSIRVVSELGEGSSFIITLNDTIPKSV